MPPLNREPGIPSSSRTLDTQDTIISQYSHMSRANGIPSSSMYPIDTAAQGGHREPKPGAEDNIQPRFELFTLGEGEKKVTEEPDTREFSCYRTSAWSNTTIRCTASHQPYMKSCSRAQMVRYHLHRSDHCLLGIPSTSIFTFNKEDHTLANMLRSRLLQYPHVHFAGYKVPHPLFR